MKGRWSMGNTRMISEQFVFDLKDGILQTITEIVKDDPELFLGLRGGMQENCIDVYCNCNRLFHVKEIPSRKSYMVSFDIGHARYTESRDVALGEIQHLGMDLQKDDERKKRKKDVNGKEEKSIVQCEISAYDPAFWSAVVNLRKRWFKDYFNGKSHDFFKNQEKPSGKIEKTDQQKLIRYNMPRANGFCVYDAEYTEPNFKKRRFDLLALQIDEAWNAVALWILEVKSTGESLDKDSGIEDHYVYMDNYTKNPEYARQRWADVKEIIAVYQALDLPGWRNLPAFADKHDESSMKYGFVMTSKADAHAQEYRNQFDCPFFIPNRKDKDNFVLDINEQEQKSEPTP
jgi:hypothetical protein